MLSAVVVVVEGEIKEGLTCYRDKKEHDCPDGLNMAMSWPSENWDGGAGKRKLEEDEDVEWEFILSMSDELVRLLPGGVITHANVHACRRGLRDCNPFVGKTRLLTDSDAQVKNIMTDPEGSFLGDSWNLSYTAGLRMKAGTYDVFSHVYFNVSNATDDGYIKSERIRWDVTMGQTNYSVKFNANFLLSIILIFVLYFVFVVALLVVQHRSDDIYTVEDEDNDTDFEREAREQFARKMELLHQRINKDINARANNNRYQDMAEAGLMRIGSSSRMNVDPLESMRNVNKKASQRDVLGRVDGQMAAQLRQEILGSLNQDGALTPKHSAYNLRTAAARDMRSNWDGEIDTIDEETRSTDRRPSLSIKSTSDIVHKMRSWDNKTGEHEVHFDTGSHKSLTDDHIAYESGKSRDSIDLESHRDSVDLHSEEHLNAVFEAVSSSPMPSSRRLSGAFQSKMNSSSSSDMQPASPHPLHSRKLQYLASSDMGGANSPASSTDHELSSPDSQNGNAKEEDDVSGDALTTSSQIGQGVMNRLSVSRRTHYTTLAAIYVWSAIFGLPYVKDRTVYRYTRTLFLVFNSGFYRVFMVAVALCHMTLTFWEPASERLIDLNLEGTARLALFESIFVGVYILDIHLRTYLQSTRSMFQAICSRELNGDKMYFVAIACASIDVCRLLFRPILCNPTDTCTTPGWFIFRFSRLVRPYFLIRHLDYLQADIMKVLASLIGVMDVLVLGFSLVLIFALFGYINFRGCDKETYGCDFNFDSMGRSVLALFMLFTTENYELVYETWAQKPASIVYFITVTVFFIFLTATFLSSIHSSFRQYRSVQVVKMLRLESINLAAAFECMDVAGNEELHKEDWIELMKVVKPDWNKEEALAAFDEVDADSSDSISLDEFVLACDVLRGQAHDFVDVGGDLKARLSLQFQRWWIYLQTLAGVGDGDSFWNTTSQQEKNNTLDELKKDGSLTQTNASKPSGSKFTLEMTSAARDELNATTPGAKGGEGEGESKSDEGDIGKLDAQRDRGSSRVSFELSTDIVVSISETITRRFTITRNESEKRLQQAGHWADSRIAHFINFVLMMCNLYVMTRFESQEVIDSGDAKTSKDRTEESSSWYKIDDVFAVMTVLHLFVRAYDKGRVKFFRRAHNMIEFCVTMTGGPVMLIFMLADSPTNPLWTISINLRLVRSIRVLTGAFTLSYSMQRHYLYHDWFTAGEEHRQTSFNSDTEDEPEEGKGKLAFFDDERKRKMSAMFSHLAYIFDVKGLWTNFTKLAPIIRRMVILLCVAIYPFAIIGMELFAGRNVPCPDDDNLVRWDKCEEYDTYGSTWDFQTFQKSLFILYQVFYTGDVRNLLVVTINTQGSKNAWYNAVIFWTLYYMVIFTIILDTIISNVIDHFELVRGQMEARRHAERLVERENRSPRSARRPSTQDPTTRKVTKKDDDDDNSKRKSVRHTNADLLAEKLAGEQMERERKSIMNTTDIRLQAAQRLKSKRQSMAGVVTQASASSSSSRSSGTGADSRRFASARKPNSRWGKLRYSISNPGADSSINEGGSEDEGEEEEETDGSVARRHSTGSDRATSLTSVRFKEPGANSPDLEGAAKLSKGPSETDSELFYSPTAGGASTKRPSAFTDAGQEEKEEQQEEEQTGDVAPPVKMMSMEKSGIRGKRGGAGKVQPPLTLSDGSSRRVVQRTDSVGSTKSTGEVAAESVTDPDDIEFDSFRQKSARMAQNALAKQDGQVAL